MKKHRILAVTLLFAACLALVPSLLHAQEEDPVFNNLTRSLEPPTEIEDQEVDESKWVFPSSGAQRSQRPDQVFLAFPHDNAHYLLGSTITLGWQPVLEPSVHVSHYEIVVLNSNPALSMKDTTGLADGNTVTTYLFTPKQAGRYYWTVRIVTEDGDSVSAVGRYLNILE